MKDIKKAHGTLEDLKYEIKSNSNSLSEKLEYVGKFIDSDLEDIISVLDDAVDRIEELENDLEDAQKAAEEWEEKYNALI